MIYYKDNKGQVLAFKRKQKRAGLVEIDEQEALEIAKSITDKKLEENQELQ